MFSHFGELRKGAEVVDTDCAEALAYFPVDSAPEYRVAYRNFSRIQGLKREFFFAVRLYQGNLIKQM